jgi:hypothetical protein
MCDCPDLIPDIYFRVRPIGKGKYRFVLTKDYTILLWTLNADKEPLLKNFRSGTLEPLDWTKKWGYLTVPEGFESDLASIPNYARLILDSKQNVAAAVCHDYLWYKNKKLANDIFQEILRREGTSKFKIWLMVNAVNLKSLKDNLKDRLLGWWRVVFNNGGTLPR